MGEQRKINIFLASSIVEFANERMVIENFIRNISDDFEEHYNIKIKPWLCENIDDVYTLGRKQDEYNQIIRDSEFCFFIFFTKVGEYTREEFETARKHFESFGKPKIYTYFKVVEDGKIEQSVRDFMEELDKTFGHFYSTFSHIDTVKLRILLSIKLQEMDFLEVKVEDGKCVVDGKPVMGVDKVAEFANNGILTEMQDKLRKVEEEYYALKPRYEAENGNPEFYKKYCAVASERQNLIDEIEEYRKLIFNISLRMINDDVHGDITARQKEAYRLFQLGDYDGCMKVLNDDDIEGDFLRERKRIKEQEIAVCRKYIKEYKTKIDILEAMKKYDKRFEDMEAIYEKIVPVALEMQIELETVYGYVCYLQDQNKDAKAIGTAEQLLPFFTDDEQCGRLSNVLGVSYDAQNQSQKAEHFYLRALDIFEKLAQHNPDRLEPDLAITCNNLGIFYEDQGKTDNAELFYLRALDIDKKLALHNPDRFEPDLANTCNNLGIFYKNQGKHGKAELFYLRALDIREKLALHNPDRFEPYLAITCNNIGSFYYYQEKADKAEHFYLRALDIYEKLAQHNPDRFEPDLAGTCNNIGLFYANQGKTDNAELFYLRALDIREKLALLNPDRFEPDLATTCNNLGIFYEDQGKHDNAELFYLRALDIREKLALHNPDRFEPDLADTCNNIGLFYADQGKHDKAELFYLRALDIFEKLALLNPDRFEPDLAMSCNNLGIFYANQGKTDNAELFYLRALDIYEKLALHNSDRFEPDLATTCNNIGNFYANQGKADKAELFYLRALDIREKLALHNPDRFEPDLAMSYFNFAIFKNNNQDIFKKSLALAEKHPGNPYCKLIINF